jgi:hypothetical protein
MSSPDADLTEEVQKAKTLVITGMSAKAEVRRQRGSKDEWEATLFQLLTQLASATMRYHEAHRDMQGLALHVTEMQC